MDAVKNLYIVRHGQTDYNLKRIVQGRSINASLNETGNTQAKHFFDAYKNIKFEAIYASSLLRSQQTIASFVDGKIPYYEDPLLDEISWGDYEGKAPSAEKRSEFEAMLSKWDEGETDFRMPNGESADDLHNRVKDFLTDLAKTNDETILICSHGRTIRLILCELTGIPISKMLTYNPNNLGLYQLNWTPNNLANIIKQNDLTHFNNSSDFD